MNKKITLKSIWQIVKESFSGFIEDKVVKLSGALAFFTVFSMGPMLIVIIYFADLFWGREAIEGTIYGQIKDLVGHEAALQLQEIIKNASQTKQSTTTAVVGFITLLIGATTVFAEIQDTINTIWNLKAKPKKNWLKMIVDRVLSFSVVVSLGFILLVSLIINGLIEAFSNRLMTIFPEITVIVLYIVNLLVTFAVVTTLFAIIFKVLPDARIKWKDVLMGAMVTAALFMIGKFGITFYIGNSNIGSAYGTAGSLVVILMWVYFSAMILYLGAEFTKAYAANYGSRIHPNKYAVWTKQIEVEDGKGSLKAQEQKKKEENEKTGDHVKIK